MVAYKLSLDLDDLGIGRGHRSRSRVRFTLAKLLREKLYDLSLRHELRQVAPRTENGAGAHGLVTQGVTKTRDRELAPRKGALGICGSS